MNGSILGDWLGYGRSGVKLFRRGRRTYRKGRRLFGRVRRYHRHHRSRLERLVD